MTHTVTAVQPAAGLSSPPQTIPCPACGFRGPHQPIHGTHLECGRLPRRVGPRTHLGGCAILEWRSALDLVRCIAGDHKLVISVHGTGDEV